MCIAPFQLSKLEAASRFTGTMDLGAMDSGAMDLGAIGFGRYGFTTTEIRRISGFMALALTVTKAETV